MVHYTANGIHNLWRKIYKNANRLFFFLLAIAWILSSIISSLLGWNWTRGNWADSSTSTRTFCAEGRSHCAPSQLKTYAITFKCNENTIAPIDYEIIMKTKFRNKYKMAMTMQWYFPAKLVFSHSNFETRKTKSRHFGSALSLSLSRCSSRWILWTYQYQ